MRHETQLRNELKPIPSPKLIQFLTLLQIPTVELDLLIRKELENNPCLEEVVEVSQETSESSEEYNIVELFGEEVALQPTTKSEEVDPMENIPAIVTRLGEELLRQARSLLTVEQQKIAEFVVINLNDDGFLLLSDEEIAESLGVTVEAVRAVVEAMRHFTPIGCATKSVKESFLVQLEEQGYDQDCLEYIIVRDCFDELSGSKRKNVLKKLNITPERLAEILKVIGELESRPGRKFFSASPGYVNPDFSVEWRENKLWAVYNDEYLPRIRVKARYIDMMKNPDVFSEEEVKFVKKRVRSAHLFLTAIEQRRMTLNRIINKIMTYQQEFFDKGYDYLKPMTMTGLAQQLGVNVSTISRAIQRKYVESPWGIHELKFFFSAPVSDIDKRIILSKIEEYINNEDKSRPFSDQEIARRLNRDGITISRRTVTLSLIHISEPTRPY